MTSRHISVHVDRPLAIVYAYASNIENLPHWATGVTPQMSIRFAAHNDLGVLDHWATINGMTFYNPMRVIDDGAGCEVVFTLRGTPEIDDEDAATIAADLARLQSILEG